MREFTKNLFSFSWAMSLFGLKQLGNVLNPQESLRGAPNAAQSFDSVTDAVVDQFGRTLKQTFEVGDKVQGEIVDLMFGFLGLRPGASTGTGTGAAVEPALQPAIFNAHSSAGEEVLITYTRGRGQFSDDRGFIALTNPIYNLDGTENGLHEGVWQAMFKSPADLLARPAPPTGSMFEPVGPVSAWPISANTIAKWTHADGSSISSVGPAASHLIPLSDGSFLFLVITGQIITEGTGRFAGARGLTQSLGATYVAAGTNLFSPQGPTTFPALTFDTFKYIIPSGQRQGYGQGYGGSQAYSGRSTGFSPFESQAVGQSNAEPAACTVTANPGDSRFVEVLGSRMRYVDTGSGEPILFLHGNPTWSYLWRKVLPHVSPTARCIAPDLIGMGLSDKPPLQYTFFDHVKYVEGFIAALGLERYTMVLHDWGCIIGFYIAMRQETRVRGLAFMEAMLAPYASWNAFPKDIAAQFKQFRTPEVGQRLIVEENLFVDRLLPASTMVPLTEEEMACYRRPFLDPASRKVILTFTHQLPVAGKPAGVARATGEYAAWLKRTKVPKLFLWSDPGLITHEKDVDWARRNLKNLKTSFLGPGLHFPQEEHPVEIGQEVARWHEEILRAPEPLPARGVESQEGGTRWLRQD
jgi:haloalkane dehalogenase